jgi:hypothetical protein
MSRVVEVVAEVAAASPAAAAALFLQVVWHEGGGLGRAAIEAPGDAATQAGCVRRVAFGVRERLEHVGAGVVEYAVLSGFPVHAHRGVVTFAPGAAPGLVRVTWTCRFTPYWGLGCLLAPVIRLSFAFFLRTLRRRAATLARAA